MPGTTTTIKVIVPGEQHMVSLLGERDQFLRQIESAFSSTMIHGVGRDARHIAEAVASRCRAAKPAAERPAASQPARPAIPSERRLRA